MQTFDHEVFGTVEFEPVDGHSLGSTEIEWADGVIDLSIWVDGAGPDREVLDELARYITDLPAFDQAARAAMHADLPEEESAVQLYVEHHQEELGTAVPPSTEAFLAAVRLSGLSLRAADAIDTNNTDTDDIGGGEAVLDYTIGEDLTQYVIAVTLGADSVVRTIAMES